MSIATYSATRAAREADRLPLSVFQDAGLSANYEGLAQSEGIAAFEPAAPEELRMLERLGFAMTQYLSTSVDFADPFVVQLRQIGLTVRGGLAWQSLSDATRRGLVRAVDHRRRRRRAAHG